MQEVISQVIDAEKRASDVLKAAEENCDRILKEANVEAEKQKQEILNDFRSKKEQILNLGKEKAKEFFEEKLHSYELESNDVKDRAKLSYEKAVSFVLERMVD